MVDYLCYYDLEQYLFVDVHARFHAEGSLSAFDFFSIIIWKANRAKSKVARRLLKVDPRRHGALEPVVRDLAKSLFMANSAQDRLQILMKDWGFLLPIASAILTVVWPEDFTVYDVRACEQLSDFTKLGDATQHDRIWTGYQAYRDAVRRAVPGALSLRDCNGVLWARSAATKLTSDISRCFAAAHENAGSLPHPL